MRRELTRVEQDALRLIKGGGPYPLLAVGVALTGEPHKHSMGIVAHYLRNLKSEGIIYDNPDGTVDTSWTMEEILQGWKEC